MTKTTKVEEAIASNNKTNIKDVTIGLGLFLAVLSIGYSSTVVVLGTDGLTPIVLIAPQVILASWIAVKKFIKQGE